MSKTRFSRLRRLLALLFRLQRRGLLLLLASLLLLLVALLGLDFPALTDADSVFWGTLCVFVIVVLIGTFYACFATQMGFRLLRAHHAMVPLTLLPASRGEKFTALLLFEVVGTVVVMVLLLAIGDGMMRVVCAMEGEQLVAAYASAGLLSFFAHMPVCLLVALLAWTMAGTAVCTVSQRLSLLFVVSFVAMLVAMPLYLRRDVPREVLMLLAAMLLAVSGVLLARCYHYFTHLELKKTHDGNFKKYFCV